MEIVIHRDTFGEGDNERLSFIISLMAFLLFVSNCANELESITRIPQSTISNISKGILLLSLVCCFGAIARHIKLRMIIYILSILALSIYSYMFAQGNETVIGTIRDHFLTVFPIVIVVCAMDEYSSLNGKLLKVSYIIIPASFLLMFFRSNTASDYTMGLANTITLPVVMMLYEYYKRSNIFHLILAGVGTFVIFVMGSRGALLGIVVFEVFILLRGCKEKRNRNKSIVIIALILLAFIFLNQILEFLSALLGRRGWSSRTLWILLNDFGHSSGREIYYEKMEGALQAAPFSFRGIGGERYALSGGYAHNFVLELLMDFGIIVGGLTTIYILYQAWKTIRDFMRNETEFNMCRLIMFSVSLPMALISGTFWNTVYLWIWLFMEERKSQEELYEWNLSY